VAYASPNYNAAQLLPLPRTFMSIPLVCGAMLNPRLATAGQNGRGAGKCNIWQLQRAFHLIET